MSITQKYIKKEISLENLSEFSKEVLSIIQSKQANGCVFVGLVGNLGSGKSTFCKQLFKVMGVDDEVVSPTYVLNISYKTEGLTVEHLDVWRIEKFEEIEKLGIQKMIENNSIIVVEWADKFKDEFEKLIDKEQLVWIYFEQTDNEDTRLIELKIHS